MAENDTVAVTRSQENLKTAQRTIDTRAATDHLQEAAGCAEEIIYYLAEMWGERGFTPEQSVYALALVTINFRETLPDKYGGKAMFDRVAAEARAYYDKNK